MASRAVQLIPAIGLGLAISTVILGSVLALGLQADRFVLSAADLAAARFTVAQAGLSALVATVLAVPLARALFRRRFPGRSGLIAVLAAPFVLPVVVAVLGLLAVFGRNGPVNSVLEQMGVAPMSIFGLQGIILANVFFNLPLATRMILQGWQAVPVERLRLASALSMPAGAQFRHIELPMLRAQIPGVLLTIFLVCLGSFAIALMLGGGPASSTLELAIYQALRFDFDLGRAALLAVVQFVLCAATTLLAFRFARDPGFGAGMDRSLPLDVPGGWRRAADAVVIALAASFLVLPLMAVVARGLPGIDQLPDGLWLALARSFGVAIVSMALALAASLTLALTAAQGRNVWFDLVAMLPLAASSLVLGTGLFVLLRGLAAPEVLALPVTALINALFALPYLYRLLLPEARQLFHDYGRLTAALDLPLRAQLRFVILPRLARPLGYGAGLAAALSMGDLGAIALFAGERGVTLPLLVQRLMGAYRMEQAAAAALVLIAASFALFWILDRIGARLADT